ncbi:MAG: exopolyphosphatase [Magnetococcales bacterium]|nr:exopolyphosphatase [Magnetococcales bacterium]
MKLAAIDVGSNAVRLLISNVYEIGDWKPLLRKADLYRVPVRLGEDAFVRGAISSRVADDLVSAMAAFDHLMKACHVEDYMACATSAMRCADNGDMLAQRILEETGVDLQIIGGAKEAEYIAMNRLDARFLSGNYLYIDVGGGSTELSLYLDGALKASKSFKMGTIRLKESLVGPRNWAEVERWVTKNCQGVKKLKAIGSGGNVNKIFKLTGQAQETPLCLKKFQKHHALMAALSMEERMIKLGMRPDRADVIVPAGAIFISVMKWARIKKIIVPQIGLADGLIHLLYRKHKDKRAG